jgi:hypothetical protein
MDLKKMLPFLEEDELKELADKLCDSPDGTYQGVSMKQLLPFLEEDEVDALMLSAYQKGLPVTSFYPFASDEGLAKLAKTIVASAEPKASLRSLLPFLDDGTIASLAAKVISSDGNYGDLSYREILPFMEDEDIDKAFLQLAISNDPQAKSFAPFVSDKAFHELVERYWDGSLQDFDFDAYYPFMDDDDIRALFRKAQKD